GIQTPLPIETPMVSGCNSFYKVVSGDTCSKIASAKRISLSQFYAWNKHVGSTCKNLLLGYYVCVG
ncbi:carbohydrate-binding module family 50 protein, partial [Stipitochalara longipes BDJ]